MPKLCEYLKVKSLMNKFTKYFHISKKKKKIKTLHAVLLLQYRLSWGH